jgi:Hydantoinase/oxoprolinase
VRFGRLRSSAARIRATSRAFGGGGPLHAVDVGRLLGIRRVLVSPVSGVFSAAGMLAAEAVHEFVRPLLIPLAGVAPDSVREAMTTMAVEGRAALAGEGYDKAAVQLRYAADIRYLGQSSQLTVPMPSGCYDAAALLAGFEKLYFETFGYFAEGESVALVNLRLSAIGKAASRLHFERLVLDSRALAGESGERIRLAAAHPDRGTARCARRFGENESISGPGSHRKLRHHNCRSAALYCARCWRWLHRDRDGGQRWLIAYFPLAIRSLSPLSKMQWTRSSMRSPILSSERRDRKSSRM